MLAVKMSVDYVDWRTVVVASVEIKLLDLAASSIIQGVFRAFLMVFRPLASYQSV